MQLVLPHLLCAALFASVVCVLARRAVQEYREFHRYPNVAVHLGSVRRRAVSRHERIGSPTFVPEAKGSGEWWYIPCRRIKRGK